MADDQGTPWDPALGTRRARAAALLLLALPGSAYIYQGEELGLPEVEDIPDEARQDPVWTRSGHTIHGRDGCRVPLPWAGDSPPYGFTREGATTWLPQPAGWAPLTAAAQQHDPSSMLSLYRAAIRIRKQTPAFHGDDLTWHDAPANVLDFVRGDQVRCVVNIGDPPVTVDPDRILLTSEPLQDGQLPADTAAWLRAD